MKEQREQIDAVMEEQRKLLDMQRQLDPLSDDYRNLQKTISKNSEIIYDLTKQIRDEDQEQIETDLKMEEIELRKKEFKHELGLKGMDMGNTALKAGLGFVAFVGGTLLIYKCEQDELLPANKISKVWNFLPIFK